MRMNKAEKIAVLAVFIAFLAVFFVLMPAMPDVEFSQQENRYLQTLPEFSFEALAAGDFTADFEEYTTDQFPFRDNWTALKARAELALGKKENNGVYYCDGGVLITDFDAPSQQDVDQNIDYLNTLVDNVDVPVYFGLIPGAGEVQSSLLPENAPIGSQQAVIDWAYGRSRAINIDVQSALGAHKDEYIFYRTDHHWTSLGAFYGYQALCEAMGLPAPSLSDYERETVSDSFYGTTWSSSGFAWVPPDTMETFVPDDGSVTVTDYGKNPPAEGPLYDTSFLEVKDKYSMFLGGNSSLRSIETGHDGPKLLVVRDSYSDSLAPFLLENFSRIDLVDLRYYKSSLAAYAAENDFDSILVLYSVSNFSTDRNLFLLEF